MKQQWTKKELIDALKEFKDDDEILINIHDGVFYEDNYEFYIDPILMRLGKDESDDTHQIWLCPVQNVVRDEPTLGEAVEKYSQYYKLDVAKCEMSNWDWVIELAKASTVERHSYWNEFKRINLKQI